MALAIVGVNGIPTLKNISATLDPVYRAQLVVVSGAPGAGEIQTNGTDGDSRPIVTSGTDITLPSSETYEDHELNIYLNGKKQTYLIDYNFVGAGPGRTQIEFTFDLYVDDLIEFKKERDA